MNQVSSPAKLWTVNPLTAGGAMTEKKLNHIQNLDIQAIFCP
jgi:hypothetical protein